MASERAEAIDLGVEWEPNVQDPLLIQTGSTAVLAVNPHFDDRDQRALVFVWSGCRGALLGDPNDEARNGHPLWHRGLSGCGWAAEVHHSAWIARLELQNRAHPQHDPVLYQPLRHFILLFHDSTFEVLAESVEVEREDRASVVDRAIHGSPSLERPH
jgi:hypothetical protein